MFHSSHALLELPESALKSFPPLEFLSISAEIFVSAPLRMHNTTFTPESIWTRQKNSLASVACRVLFLSHTRNLADVLQTSHQVNPLILLWRQAANGLTIILLVAMVRIPSLRFPFAVPLRPKNSPLTLVPELAATDSIIRNSTMDGGSGGIVSIAVKRIDRLDSGTPLAENDGRLEENGRSYCQGTTTSHIVKTLLHYRSTD
jgi:hypothetical protein